MNTIKKTQSVSLANLMAFALVGINSINTKYARINLNVPDVRAYIKAHKNLSIAQEEFTINVSNVLNGGSQ